MKSKTALGAYLQSEMKKKNLTKDVLAIAAGISVSTVGQILRGDIKKPPMKRLTGFSIVLGVDVEVLVALIEAKENSEQTAA